MFYSAFLRVLLIILFTSIGIVYAYPLSAAVPTTSPSPTTPVGGIFSLYFSNMTSGCTGSSVVSGFDTTPLNYMKPLCLDINSIIGSYLIANPISTSPWINGLLSSIHYLWGNVGIGTATPGAKLKVTGNIIADTPLVINHVTTKDMSMGDFSLSVPA